MVTVYCTRLNPAVLKWARTNLNIDLPTAARRCDIGEEALRDFESGDRFPSVPQLRRLASFYQRPIATFFLPTAPAALNGPRDFRTNTRPLTRDTLLSVRRARAVQRFTGELSSPQVPDFWPHDNNPENSAIAARRWLGLTDDEQTAGREPRDLFNLLIHKLDNQGIEVLVHRFPRDDAKAYCLAEPQQIIVISANDPTVGSRNFSLMHELCHLSRGVSGLCITQDIQTSIGEERTCDKFAANLLMPETLIRSVVGGLRGVELTDSIDALAERVKCSKEALLIRFKELNLISGEELQDKLRELRQRTLPRGRGSSSRTSNLIKDCGLALPNLVFSAYRNEIVGPYEAAKILNINQARLDEVGSRLGYL